MNELKILLIAGRIQLPLMIVYSQKNRKRLKFIYTIIAIMATLVFGNIASLAIYQIIKDKTVFMTSIHALFLNPFFLITGNLPRWLHPLLDAAMEYRGTAKVTKLLGLC